MRSTRQRSKPVNVILRKTEFGYEVLEDKSAEPLPRTKTTVPKGDKAGSPEKSSIAKSAEKDGDNGSVPPTPIATAPKKQKGALKSNLKASKQSQQQLKSPSVHTESEAQRRDEMASPSDQANQDAMKNDASSTTAQERPEKPENTGRFERAERAERPEKMVKIVEPKFTEPKLLDLNSYEHLKVTKKYPVLVPTIANWFDLNKIHQIEREGLPEFFSGKPSKTPEVYKKYRNFILTLFRSNPRHYLHATTCRRSLAGDVNGIIRVHNFLEQWGLINFNVDPTTYPQNLFMTKPNFGLESKFKAMERGVTSELGQLEKLNQARNSESDLLLSQIRILNKQSRPLCHQCGLICGIVWYNQKGHQNQAKMYGEGMTSEENTLCLRCFTEGNLPAQAAQSDFHRVDLLNKYSPNFPKNPNPSYWTQEETIRLLDLFELDKDPWEEVPRYFPYKTKDDIILHWLQLPVKNISLLEALGLDEEEDTHDKATAESLTELAQGMLDEFSNPLISQLGVFKEVLDKFSGAKSGKEGMTEEKFEEGYEQQAAKGGRGEGQMEIEVDKQQDAEGVTVEGQAGEGQNAVAQGDPTQIVSKRYDIEVVQLDKTDVERKKMDERIERLYTIIDKEGQIVDEVEKETRHRADMLRKKEEDKIRETANILIDLQINKLEAKLSFLEEYEKVLGQEKKQNEMFQKMLLADKINLVHKRLDAAKPPPAAQTQTQTQNQQQQPFFDGKEQQQQQQQQQQPQQPAYFGFNYQMGNVNIDDMLSLGPERIDEFPADGF